MGSTPPAGFYPPLLMTSGRRKFPVPGEAGRCGYRGAAGEKMDFELYKVKDFPKKMCIFERKNPKNFPPAALFD